MMEAIITNEYGSVEFEVDIMEQANA